MNLRFPNDWIAKANAAFTQLADRPWLLFALLLAVNSITRPYAGITHDTRLYSAQVLNRVEAGAYADDLFFRYGSQDEYSLFSRFAAPVVYALGVSLGFFVLYIASKSLLIFGMMRLVQTLIPNRTAGVLALVYCMVVPIRYGGQFVLNVQETFLTPRMLAIALVLIGLDYLLRGRPFVSLLALLLGASLHPLMAFGGLLVWGAYHAWKYLGGWAFLAISIALAGVAGAVLWYEPLALRVFGVMDDTWRDTIMHASSFNFPSEWGWEDWWYLGFELALGAVALWQYRQDADKARFTAILLLVTVAATVGTALAENLPYALLLQGQPYRALWILACLHLAWAFWLYVEWAQSESQWLQLLACGLLAYLCCYNGLFDEMLFPLFAFPFAVLLSRGLERAPRDPAWLPHSLQVSLVIGSVCWVGYKYLLLTANLQELISRHPEMRDVVEVYFGTIGPVAVLLVVAWLLVRAQRSQLRWGAGVIAVSLAFQLAIFAVPETEFYAEHCSFYRADLRRMRQELHAPADKLPTVYSNLGCLDYIWIDLHSKSYFDWWQAGGFMFRREMAMEGQRRAMLVAPFEIERFRKQQAHLTIGDKEVIGRFFKIDFDKAHLSIADLARLSQEPGLDYILVEQRFDGLFAAHHGKLYLYRCSEVRSALGLPAPATPVVVAAR